LIAAAAALMLAGCGGSSNHAAQTTPSTGASSSTSTPGTTSTTPASPPTSTTAPAVTTTARTSDICRASELSASYLGGQAATGHGLLGFALRNESGHTCSTYGYPGIQFLTQNGQALPTVPTHTTTDFFGSLPKPPLTVAPGGTVSFRLGVTHGAASPTGCDTAYALQVIPPNDTATLRIQIPGGAYECQTVTVSPVQRGTSAYP
jgi:hypothetical protein